MLVALSLQSWVFSLHFLFSTPSSHILFSLSLFLTIYSVLFYLFFSNISFRAIFLSSFRVLNSFHRWFFFFLFSVTRNRKSKLKMRNKKRIEMRLPSWSCSGYIIILLVYTKEEEKKWLYIVETFFSTAELESKLQMKICVWMKSRSARSSCL